MKTRSATAAAAMWLGLVATAAPAVPQGSEPAGPEAAFAERIEVELVNVDVWVTDRGGDPATGLAAADFEILHDGRPVPITHFTEIRGGSEYRQAPAEEPAPDAAAATAERDPTAFFPGHVVVYFDQSRLHPRNSKGLVQSLTQLLDLQEVAPERVMIVRQERNLFVEAPFGSPKKELEAALERLARGAAGGLALETETQQAVQAIRSTWEQIQDSVGSAQGSLGSLPGAGGLPGDSTGGSPRTVVGGVGSGAGPDACGPLFNQIGPILDGFTRSQAQRIGVTLANLSDTASFLAGLPGIKALLYLSDGLDTRPGAALASYASSLCPAQAADLLSAISGLELSTPFMELTRHANANRVTIYALQASGLRPSSVGDARSERNARGGGGFRSRGAFESTQRSGEREGLRLLADETGGRTIFNRNDLGPELTKIGRDLGTYYSLAFEPPADHKAGREHRLEIKLRDDSLSARYRRGYLDKNPDQWLAEKLEGALNLGITSNPLEVRLGAGEAQHGGEGTFKLPLHVMVPVERLVFRPEDGSSVAEVTVRAMARSFTTSILAIRDQTFRVRGAPGATGWANLTLELELGEGTHATAVGVRDEVSGEVSYVATTLQTGS